MRTEPGSAEVDAAGACDGLGDFIRHRRQAAGLTQEELGECCGLSVRAISDIERGRTVRPFRRSLDRLSGALGLAEPALKDLVRASLASSGRVGGTAPVPAGQPGSPGHGGPVVPRQLPVAVRHFAGRADELKALDQLLDESADVPGMAMIVAICGTAGVGKTALAVHWGHRVADRFPDGQLYVDLRGFCPSGASVSASSALRSLLAALHVPPAQIPQNPDAQAGLYRSLLVGKRTLLILDNARDAAQVRPLLPGSVTCSVIVTSRSRLVSLAAAEGACLLCLDVLSEAEARELLSRRIGPERAHGEPAAVTELTRLCARLPLALALAAARAAAVPSCSLTALAAELRHAQHRLDELDAGDAATSLRAVFSWSYRRLSDPAARMFRLLGVHPGPDVSAAAAASLAGVRPDQAREAVKELVVANLIAQHAAGRFAFHDLLRAYAADLADESDSEAERRAATHRVLDHYRQTAWAAERLLHPIRSHPSLPPPCPGVPQEDFADHDQALRWLRAEHHVLLAAVTQAAKAGFDTHAWQISCALRTFFDRQGHWEDWASSECTALSAAERAGDLVGQAQTHRGLALARIQLGSLPDAHAHLQRAIDLSRQIGDRVGQGNAHLDTARILGAEDRLDQALSQSELALELFRQAGHRPGEARALNAVGWYHALLGRPGRTLSYCQQPLETLREFGDRHGESAVWDSLAYAHLHLGHYDDAITCYRQALRLLRDVADRYMEAIMLIRLGEAHDAANDRQAARKAWQEALTLLEELRHPDASLARDKLRGE
jgi:tetratricopeptide (TPR) repeat protein